MKNWQFWIITGLLLIQTILMIIMSVSGIQATLNDIDTNTSQTVWWLETINNKLIK